MSLETFISMLDFGWIARQITQGNPLPFLIWTAFVFAVAFAFGRWLSGSRLDALVVKELGRTPGFERVNTVRKLIEKADELAHEVKDMQGAEARGEDEQICPHASKPSISALISIGQYYAAGVLDALRRTDAGEGYIGFGENVEASLDLIKHSNGIIARVETSFMGCRSSEDKYYVTSEWAAFLALPDNRRALEKLAGDTGWPR